MTLKITPKIVCFFFENVHVKTEILRFSKILKSILSVEEVLQRLSQVSGMITFLRLLKKFYTIVLLQYLIFRPPNFHLTIIFSVTKLSTSVGLSMTIYKGCSRVHLVGSSLMKL